MDKIKYLQRANGDAAGAAALACVDARNAPDAYARAQLYAVATELYARATRNAATRAVESDDAAIVAVNVARAWEYSILARHRADRAVDAALAAADAAHEAQTSNDAAEYAVRTAIDVAQRTRAP